jgi:predicted RNA binding protein with dsRBD fold (UPF0201 family)
MKSFTVEELKSSKVYKDCIGEAQVVKIHDTYHDDPMDYAAYIVITKRAGKYNITRFFKNPSGLGGIQVSVDKQNISAEEVFDDLLNKYSSGL